MTTNIRSMIMRAFVGVVASVVIGLASSAYAVDGTWTNLTTGGLWSNTGNWSSGIIADGSGFTANFNTLNITADNTVKMDASHTLGNLIFGDATPSSAFNWTIDNNSVAGNILTLAGGTPTITVNALGTGKSASITAVIAGSAGLVKDGAGTLSLGTSALSGTVNTFTGGLFIKAGAAGINYGGGSGSTGAITIGDSTGSAPATLYINGVGGATVPTFPNAIILGDTSGALTISEATAGAVSFSGGVTGANNLNIALNHASGGSITFLTGSLNNSGTINNAGTGVAAGTVTISSSLGSNVKGLIENSATKLILSGASASFIGDTTLTTGTLNLQNINALQNSVLKMNGGSVTFGTSTTVGLTSVALGGLSGSVNINLNNFLTTPTAVNLTLGNSNATYGGNTLNPTYSGVLSSANGAASLTKVGINTQTLTGASTYTGATAVNGGTLDLGGSTANGSLASTALNLGGGTFSYTRTGGTQAFTTTTATAGLSAIRATAGLTLTLGTLASSGGTVDIGNTGIITTSTANNNGIIGSWATFNNGTTWAVANGASAITGLADATYTLTSVAGTTVANYLNANIDVDNSAGLLDGVITPYSLRFNTASATTVTLATGINTITSGGILVTPAVGANLSTITGGTLKGAASASLNVIQNNTTTGGGLTIGSIIADNGGATGLAKAGAGLLTLTGVNTYTGSTTISGTLVIGTAGSLNSGAYAGTIVNNGELVYGSSAAQTLSGIISGTGSVTKDTSSSSTLTLSGANTFNGGLVIKAGAVTLGTSAKAGGAGSITIGAAGSADATLNLPGSLSFGNPIILGGSSGTLLITQGSANTTSVTGGVTGTGNLSFNKSNTGGAFQFSSGSLNNTGTITIVFRDTTQVQITSVIGSAVKGLTLSATGSGGFLSLGTASPAFIGDTTLTAGQLRLANANALQKSVLNMNGGTVAYTGTDYTLGGLSGTGNLTSPTGNLALGNSNDSYGGNTLNPTYSGVLSGSGSLTKIGTNTQTFAGANTYSGGTTVSNGTLLVNNTTGSGTGVGAVSVATNATLGGVGMITGLVTVASGGTLSPGTNSVGRLTVGSLKLDANATFAIQIASQGSNNYCVVSTGAVDIASSILSLTVAPGYIPKFNDTFTIIRNVKGDAVIGTFAVGTRITAPGMTEAFEISTTGGAGNDVVLRYTGGGGTLIQFM